MKSLKLAQLAVVVCVALLISIDMPALVENYQGDGNRLNTSLVQKGDVILMKGCKKMADLIGGLFPGYWHHAAIAESAGYYGIMIEAWTNGVRRLDTRSTLTVDEAAIYRVNTSSTVKNNAVSFAAGKIGRPYDYGWLLWPGTKSTGGSTWYCSELAWAGYKVNGVDIDANPGYHWMFWNNVAPGELADDGNTYQIARSN